MTLVVNLNEEQEARLHRVARQHGLPTEEYAQQLLERLAEEDSDEAWQADLDALADGSADLPVLAPEATTRARIYGDRG